MATFIFASVLLAITPGADMTLMLGRTLSQGRAAGFSILAGTVTGCFIHIAAAVIGISALLAASPTGFLILKILGALYMLYLAFQAVANGSSLTHVGDENPKSDWSRNFLMGLGVNILNPKVVVFFLTFLPQFVSAADPLAWKKMLFLGLLFNAVSTPISAMILLTADRFSSALKSNPKISRYIDYMFASVFTAFAVKIVMTEGR